MTDCEPINQSVTSVVSNDPFAPAAPWSIRQQLALCTSILTYGNENWNPVSKSLRLFAEPGQESDWCAPKNCAKQYALLLDRAELRRSREYSWGELPWQELIIKRLTVERLEEVQNAIRKDQDEYRKLKEEISAIENGEVDSRIEMLWEKAKLDHGLEHYESECFGSINDSNQKEANSDETNLHTNLKISNQNVPDANHSDQKSKKSQRKVWKQLRIEQSINFAVQDSSESDNKASLDIWEVNKSSPSSTPQRRMTRNSLASATDFGSIPTLRLHRSPASKHSAHQRSIDEAPVSPGACSNSSSTSATTAMTLSSESSDATVIANEEEKSFSFHMEQETDVAKTESVVQEEIPAEPSPDCRPGRALRSKRSLGDSGSELLVMLSPRKCRKRGSRHSSAADSSVARTEESHREETSSNLEDIVSSEVSENMKDEKIVPDIDNKIEERMNNEEECRMWKKAMVLFLENVMTHKHSTVFCHPVRDDEAVGYSKMVFRPMDLHKLRRRIETGEINSTAELVRDLMFIFTNAIMYNSSQHLVYEMANTMLADIMDLMAQCLTVSLDPYVDPRIFADDIISSIIKKK